MPSSTASSMRSAPTRCSTWSSCPKRIVIAGGGYIANEFAGIFHQFGSHVTLVNRTDVILRQYDQQIVDRLIQISLRKGIDFKFHATIDRIENRDDGSLHVAMTGCDDIQADAGAVRDGAPAEHRGHGSRRGGRRDRRQGPDQGRCRQPHIGAVDLRGRRRHRSRPADPGRDPRGPGVRRHLLRQQAAPGRLWLHPVGGVQPSAARRRRHDRGPGAQQARLGQDLHLRLPAR